MGKTKRSVAWRSKWPARFRSLQRASPAQFDAFLNWWCRGLQDAFKTRFEAFPARKPNILGYLHSLKVRWVGRELKRCVKTGAPDEALPIIRTFVENVFDECIGMVAGSPDTSGSMTKEQLIQQLAQRLLVQN